VWHDKVAIGGDACYQLASFDSGNTSFGNVFSITGATSEAYCFSPPFIENIEK
jgi:hypothetical protein